MEKGYWIVRVDITDMEQYKTYVAANAAPLCSLAAAAQLLDEIAQWSPALA